MARGEGGVGGVVVVVVAVVVVVVDPVIGYTGDRGMFQLYKSCGSSVTLTNLAVNSPMWLQGVGEPATLVAQHNPGQTCILPPDITHQVTIRLYLKIHVGGVTGEEGKEEEGNEEKEREECTFPRHTVLLLRQGLVKVSCLPERSEAEAEMLDNGEPASSVPSPAGRTLSPDGPNSSPEGRALDLPTPGDATQHTPTTARPQGTHEPLAEGPTPRPLGSTGETPHSSEGQGQTTETVTGTSSSTNHPLTDETVTKTTPWKQLTEMPDDSSESPEHVETDAMADVTGGTTQETPGSSGTHQTRQTEEPTPPARSRKASIKTENISVHEPSAMSTALQPGEHTSDEPNDQVVYLAGVGAGVLALVLGVVAVVSVAHHRRRKSKAKQRQEDLFISGAYRGSMHSLTRSGSGSSNEKGAYLNANVMYYSGVEPECAESFEMEEKTLKSPVSYSSHDIPKCLK